MGPKWLEWTKEIQSIAQAGLTYSKDKYDIERFQQLRDLSVRILNQYTDIEHDKLYDLFCGEEGYQTPKVEVRGVVIQDNKILMVKENLDGKWSLPGGWAEVHLSVKENVIKEVKEEAGLDVKPHRLIAVLDRKKHNKPVKALEIYKIFVLCELLGGSFVENIETDDSGFFPLDGLPPLSEERNNYAQIEMCFKANEDEQFQTLFD